VVDACEDEQEHHERSLYGRRDFRAVDAEAQEQERGDGALSDIQANEQVGYGPWELVRIGLSVTE